MTLSDDYVELLKLVLQEECKESEAVSRSKIFETFEKRAKSGFEEYKFKKELSNLIREGRICGYEVKVGRSGGIQKTEPIERVTVSCSYGKYAGCMLESELSRLISSLKKG